MKGLTVENTEVINIYADGACRGNPGKGGWGVLIESVSGVQELCGGSHTATNNQMELTAVIRAIEALAGPSVVKVHTDSQYVQKGISQWIHNWKRNGWRAADKKPVKNAELWKQLDILTTQHTITWLWVKGHAGHPGNEKADQLANKGIDELK